MVLQLSSVVGEGELLERRLGAQEPLYGVVKRLGGSLVLSCPCLPWIATCLPAPVPDAFSFLPRSKEGPFACSSAIDPNSHLNLLATPSRWEAGSANEGLAATSSDGLDNYEEGIADTLLLPLIRRFEVSDFLVGERHLTELPTPLCPPTLVCKSPTQSPHTFADMVRSHETS